MEIKSLRKKLLIYWLINPKKILESMIPYESYPWIPNYLEAYNPLINQIKYFLKSKLNPNYKIKIGNYIFNGKNSWRAF